MKTKIILLLMVAFLPLSTFLMKADEPIMVHIPLSSQQNVSKGNRDITLSPIECWYFSDVEIIQTTVYDNLGEIAIEVLNATTGETFYETFNSTLTPQHVLPISGSAGFYTITYTTSGGDVYVGTYMLTD